MCTFFWGEWLWLIGESLRNLEKVLNFQNGYKAGIRFIQKQKEYPVSVRPTFASFKQIPSPFGALVYPSVKSTADQSFLSPLYFFLSSHILFLQQITKHSYSGSQKANRSEEIAAGGSGPTLLVFFPFSPQLTAAAMPALHKLQPLTARKS